MTTAPTHSQAASDAGTAPARWVGQALADLSGPAKTSGQAKYTGDLAFEGLLEAGVFRSPHAHAEILSIDLTEAMAIPGVIAAVTSVDFGDRRYLGMGGVLSDRPPLAGQRVRFVGEEIAAIAAETPEALAQALSVVRVRWRKRAAVHRVDDALARDAPLLHETADRTNVVRRSSRRRGAFVEPMSSGQTRVRARYAFGSQAHCCLETHTVVASWPDPDGPLDVWVPSQGPANVRSELSHVLGIAPELIRLHDVAIGGDFGSRVKPLASEAIAAMLARKTGRPVRIRLSRAEEFAATKRRYPFDVDIELRAAADGRLTRMTVDAVSDMGAYHWLGAGDFGYFPDAISSLYGLENVSVSLQGVYTNSSPPGSYRGAGGPQACFARECAIDELAQAMALDPIDLRIRNLKAARSIDTGWHIDNDRIIACLVGARDAIDWQAPTPSGRLRRGFGIAAAVHVTGVGELQAKAYVELDPTGTITVRSASADPGTGQRTVLAQVAADELGIDPARVVVVLGDTATAPFDPGLGASKGSYVSTHAVRAAGRDLADKMRLAVAAALRVNDVDLVNGFARTSEGHVAFGDIVALSAAAGEGILRGVGRFSAGRPFDNPDVSDGYAYAAQAAEVEVDTELGTVRVVRFVSVHDSGRILNPTLARGQIEGGIVMGLGAALSEESIHAEGRLVNGSFTDYACPRAPGWPSIEVIFLDHDDGPGHFKSKGLGEICLVPTAASIANAVAAASGMRVRHLPITPDKLVSPAAPVRPLWRRPERWWISAVRSLYPLGLKTVLHRWGTGRWGDPRAHSPIARTVRGHDLAGAVQALARNPTARPIAGGTDLIIASRQGLLGETTTAVSLRTIPELGEIAPTPNGGLSIGAAVTLSALARSEHVPVRSGLLEALASIATPQIRSVATLGGNLCQMNRCWFLRSGMLCYQRSGLGAPCYAIDGDHRFFHAVMDAHRCQATTPSDLATLLTALDADLQVEQVGGARVVAAANFYVGPGETVLRQGEILTRILIPEPALRRATAFGKLGLYQGGFAICSAAASLSLDGRGAIASIRVTLGGVAPTPLRARRVERMLQGKIPTRAGVSRASRAWAATAHPLRSNGWKVNAASNLAADTIALALDRWHELGVMGQDRNGRG